MPSVTADPVLQLRGLLLQLSAPTAKEEVSRLCKDILDLGRRWPDHQPLEDEGQKAFERFGRLLPKFADAQQREIVAAFRPLREDVQRRLSKAATELNAWLGEAPDEKSSPERLAAILQAIEAAPQLQWYKQCASGDYKAKFLMALASVVRSVQSESAPLHAHVAVHPSVLAAVDRLATRFFVTPTHGNVLKLWHEGRLKRYNATLWRAAKSASDQYKDDLQVRLVTALRRKASQVQGQGAKGRPHLQLELCRWPMVKCPLATAFLDFVAQRGHELGDIGKPQLSECPPHSLRPRTLCKLLERLDAFEIVDVGKDKDMPGIVRLRWEAVTALAFKALGTKPKASSAPPAEDTVPAAKIKAASAEGADLAAPASKAMPPKQPLARRQNHALAERAIPWGDARFLQRLVRRGIRAEDEEWSQLWHQFCKQSRIPADVFQSAVPKGPLTQFIERNLAMLRKKQWAKDLLYKAEGQTDEPPVDSDAESGARAGSSYTSSGPPAAAGERAHAVPGPPKAKVLDQGAGGRARVDARAPRADQLALVRPRADLVAEELSSSGSESSLDSADLAAKEREREERERAERKKEKKRKRDRGMLGYGDYGITPEVMMMNQMMGMSMMMTNPLAMMGMGGGMGAPMMPQMGMMPGMKIKKDGKLKDKGKLDAKLKTGHREPVLRKSKDNEDPRLLNKPGPAASSAKDASLIDAADL